ncbi:zinc finger CCCH domain-containing protein 15 homolog [Culex quinquefasciatus]|uniref:zinc finger CCCH domain-containing protein 15 homolog n=1 Tax=Culex quinquefasciatus TaxID=7176 RepID=UPI0018E3A336|nr:zinc finger CCCH domain-containing protein 15 homolog [Culex quinquefasciatus]
MPPKKPAAGPSKKTETKKKEKVIEDKTFGLKNKKGAKQQKFISQVEKQVKSGGHHNLAANPNAKKEEKEKKLKEQRELAALFKPVPTQKVEKGVDPKSILCAFFKQGTCTKGDKCKFSHDLTIERKAEKRSIHVDMRDGGEQANDTIENWTEEKLAEVVAKKHGKEKTMPTTTIICKYFLDAVERTLYGWFWECPNGEKCIYRHALPPGYVLKKDKKKLESLKEEISLVDLIERERAALGVNQTRVTLETFLAWKKRKILEKKQREQEEDERKRKDFKAGRQNGLSGREMFSFNPDLVDFGMDDGEEAIESYGRNEDDDEDTNEYKELDLSMLSLSIKEVDNTGTVAEEDRWAKMKATLPTVEENGEATAAAAGSTEPSAAPSDAAPINENLFLDEDLEGIDDELSDDDDDDDEGDEGGKSEKS